MKNKHIWIATFIFYSICGISSLVAQGIGISNSGSSPAASAILDVAADNKGLLIPRLTTTQRSGIASPAAGLFIYNITTNELEIWNGANWIQLSNTTQSAANGMGVNPGRGIAISNSVTSADPSSVLDIQSTTGGLLLPRLSASQRNGITTPVAGLLIYNSTTGLPDFYSGTGWIELCGTAVSNTTGSGTNAKNMGINTASPDPSAMLDVFSIKAGLAIPRLTSTQRDGILSPAQGLILFNTTSQTISVYNGAGSWLNFNAPVAPASPIGTTNNAGSTQITWRWGTVNGASGYKWNSANNYLNANDLGADTFFAQTGLTCNTSDSVYVWAYNCNGVSPSIVLKQSTLACPTGNACTWNSANSFIDNRDGQTYSEVQIGTQCWMAQDLNYGVYTPLPTASGIYQSPGEKYCSNLNCNGNDSTCPYGGLYQWNNLMNGSAGCNGTGALQPACDTPVQGLCPSGWHIPSHYEWTLLEGAVNNEPGTFPYDESSVSYFGTIEGNSLKAGDGPLPLWPSPSAGTNSSGFSALPAGLSAPHSWNGGPYEIALWNSSENTNSTLGCSPTNACAWYHFIYSSFNNVARYIAYKTSAGYSVRCVKD